jgi:electron-transferring-flavoprotein dehydrogenase
MEEIEREVLEVDVLIVGAGPAGLACAYRLKELIDKHQEKRVSGELSSDKDLSETMIAVIEKGAHVGAHSLSGAVMDPKGITELIPDYKEQGAPLEPLVEDDTLYYLTKTGKIAAPWLPSEMHNHGLNIISLNRFVSWLGEKVEEKEVDILTGVGGSGMLYDGNAVIGVRTDDKGRDKEGNPKDNFEPGADIQAKVTVLAEGVRGSLTKAHVTKLNLDDGRNPQSHITGVKEVWEIPEGRFTKGTVIHTLGFPLDTRTFGGGFMYTMKDNQLALGFAVGLNYRNPLTDPHNLFSKFKTHPFIKSILEGGKMLRYGAKAIPEGGYFSMPRMYGDGFLIAGDSAGFLNSQRLKGIHLAIKSGIMAAQTIFDGLLTDDFSEQKLKSYDDSFQKSWAKEELYKVRNFHQGFDDGLFTGLLHTGLQMVTGGKGTREKYEIEEDHKHMKTVKRYFGGAKVDPKQERISHDGKLTRNKLDSIYYSGTKHEEDQPPHLVITDYDICNTKCVEEYGNPCQHFCPADVYEMEEDETGNLKLKLNPSNCVHCKTCDIADPYGIITWVVPEGGGGPNYADM